MVRPRLVLLAPSNLPRRGRLRQRSFSAFERLFGALSQFVHLVACFNSSIKPLQFKTTTEVKAFPVGEGWMGLISLKAILSLVVAKASVIIHNFKKPFFKIVILTLLTCSISSCKSVTIAGNKLKRVRFCDLPKHVGDTVFVRAVYSGFEEYWNLEGKGCKDLRVELEILDYPNIPLEVDSMLSKVQDNYFIMTLDIEMIGVFQNEEKQYGHLGSNNGQFSVIQFHKIRQKRIK